MEIGIYKNKLECSQAAGKKAAEILKEAIAKKGKATFIAATGASQFDFLQTLIADKEIDWSKTRMFHLDEYIGCLKATLPASADISRNGLSAKLIQARLFWSMGKQILWRSASAWAS